MMKSWHATKLILTNDYDDIINEYKLCMLLIARCWPKAQLLPMACYC